MANPTTNFGWVMPTATDLVTDLPADFNVFGQGVDTSMQYLLGGTTGQVLSKTSGTNMAFTWVTPTDQTPLTTKGDLFTFTTVDARLGVGANGTVLTADSTAATGLVWNAAAAVSFVGCAAYRGSGTQSIPNATATMLTLPSEEYDSDAFHSTATNTSRFTIPTGKGGKYLVNAGLNCSTNAGSIQQMYFYVNGSAYASNGYSGGIFADQRDTTDQIWGYSGTISLSAADYLEIGFYQNSGGAVNAAFVRVSITYLGA